MVETRPGTRELPRVSSRLTFAYLEHCRITIRDGAVAATMDDGSTVLIPSASITSILLGPGTAITHHAIRLIRESHTGITWIGADGTRTYAWIPPDPTSTRLLSEQARIITIPKERLAAARRMYGIRFPGQDFNRRDMRAMRGAEGARMRRIYSEQAAARHIPWDGRRYRPDDIGAGDTVNASLSIGNAILYSVEDAVIASMGASTGLGIIHNGNARSFTYDVADLYKAETSIPVAFETAERLGPDADIDTIGRETRRAIRTRMHDTRMLAHSVTDIKTTILGETADTEPEPTITLWDPHGNVTAGRNHADDTMQG